MPASRRRRRLQSDAPKTPPGDTAEVALVGVLEERASDVIEKLLEVQPGGNCILYFDCEGGSPYAGLALMSLIRYRRLRATGVVLGSCLSAALLPFAACRQRLVFPHSVFLFHPMRWESGENVERGQAGEWARHFAALENELDELLAELFGVERQTIDRWTRRGRYMNGREFAETGLAELSELSVVRTQRKRGAADQKSAKR